MKFKRQLAARIRTGRINSAFHFRASGAEDKDEIGGGVINSISLWKWKRKLPFRGNKA